MGLIIKTTELLHLNEAAKALKQKNFIIIINNNNTIIAGIDNVNACIKFTELQTNLFYNTALNNIIINARELSAFVKTITIESEFEIKQKNDTNLYISSMNAELSFIINRYINLNKTYDIINYCNTNTPTISEENVTDKLTDLFSIHKDDGCIYYKHYNKYYMTLFYGLLPINKSDKILLSIYHNINISFIARFKVVKKHFTIHIYINYLYI